MRGEGVETWHNALPPWWVPCDRRVANAVNVRLVLLVVKILLRVILTIKGTKSSNLPHLHTVYPPPGPGS